MIPPEKIRKGIADNNANRLEVIEYTETITILAIVPNAIS